MLPSLNYDLKNNAFNVGISLNSFALFNQQKQRNKIELAKYEQSLKSKLGSDLYQISKDKYQNSEILTEQFFNLKKAYLTKINSLKMNISNSNFQQ